MERANNSPPCQHPRSISNTCTRCNKSCAVDYIHPGLKLYTDEINWLRDEDLQGMLHSKRLHLVLDLDNTLIQSASLSRKLSDTEMETIRSKKSSPSLPGEVDWDNLFIMSHGTRVLRLRNGVRQFLDVASSMFDLSIYTKASRRYAQEIAEILGVSRFKYVISKEDSTTRGIKGLDVLLAHPEIVLIVDDLEHVWCNNTNNLVRILPFYTFPTTIVDTKHLMKNSSASSYLRKNNGDEFMDEDLDRVLRSVRLIHSMFYDVEGDFKDRDVRPILQRVLQIIQPPPFVEDSSLPTCNLGKREAEASLFDECMKQLKLKRPRKLDNRWRRKAEDLGIKFLDKAPFVIFPSNFFRFLGY